MQRYCLHKAPVKNKLPSDFPQYLRWVEKRYPDKPEPTLHIPSEEKLSAYYQINNLLRIRLCKYRHLPDSERKEALIELIHKRLDENMGCIFHERNPKKWPDMHGHFTFRPSAEKKEPVARLRLLLPLKEEPIFTKEPVLAEYAYAV